MKIFKRMIPVILVLFFFGVFLSSLILYSFRQMQSTAQKLILSRKVVEESFNLNYLTYDYLSNPSKRIKFQWDITYIKLKQDIGQLEEKDLGPYAKSLLQKIIDKNRSARHYFLLIDDSIQKDSETPLADTGRKDLGSIVSVDLHQMAASIFALENIFREDFLATQRQVGIWLLTVITVFFLVFFGFVYRLFKEIYQRMKSQDELTKANEKLRLINRLVEFTGDGVYRYSYDEGKILYANQGFADILELDCSSTDLVGKRLEEVFYYIEEPGTIRSLIDEKKNIRGYPYRFRTLAGKEKWVLHNSFLIEDKSGKKILEAIITDITEKRKAEQRNEFLAGILDSSPLSVIATDKERKIIYVNPATEELFGYSQKELMGKDPIIFNAEPESENIEAEIMKILEKDRMYSRRILNKKKNGQFFNVETSIYRLNDSQGNFVALVGFQKDITQELKVQEKIKESEVKFRNIFEKAGSAIFVADPDNGEIIDCNKSAEELIGMPRKELIGLKQYKIHPEKEKDKYKRLFFSHVRKGAGSGQGKIQDKQGRVKPVWISASFFNFANKNLLVGFFTDLSARVELVKKEKEVIKTSVKLEAEHAKAEELGKAYTQLKDMQDKLVEAEKLAALGKLSGIVAHDLRNPLAVIRNSAYLLRKNLEGTKDSRVIKYLELLDEEVDVADSIIEEVLSFTRIKNIKLSSFKINEIAEKVLTKINIPESVKIIKSLDKSIPAMQGDKEQLQRLMTNLIRNAVEAMPEGGKLTITAAFKDTVILIKISDTGVGIDKEEADRIFEPMFSTKIHGTGLGLPACKNIVEAHKGHISVKSQKGKGTVVSVVLPFLAADQSE